MRSSGSGNSTTPPSRSLARARADRALVERARREGTPEARRAAVEGLLPLAHALARRFHRGSEPLEDLEQVAAYGLLKAIDGFDLDRDTRFGSYAIPTIAGELRRHYRDRGWTVRVPRDLQELSLRIAKVEERATSALGRTPTLSELADRLDEPIERVLEARELGHAMHPDSLDRPAGRDAEDAGQTLLDRVGAPDDGFAQSDHTLTADQLLAGLCERDRTIVELRFREELSQSEIGERLGYSQMHISRLLRRALAQLNAAAEADAIAS